jgi:hypothetical protein
LEDRWRRRFPYSAEARWDEYYPGEGVDAVWDRFRHVCLAKCAEAMAHPIAFPAELGGMYTPEEMPQARYRPKRGDGGGAASGAAAALGTAQPLSSPAAAAPTDPADVGISSADRGGPDYEPPAPMTRNHFYAELLAYGLRDDKARRRVVNRFMERYSRMYINERQHLVLKAVREDPAAYGAAGAVEQEAVAAGARV